MHTLGGRGTPGDPEERLAVVRKLVDEAGEVQLLDARLVVGQDHLASAGQHAERAMREGTNVAKSLAVEFVLYASGERQIADALRKMGIREDTTEFALVLFRDADADAALVALGLTRDDRVLDPSLEKLRAFGLTDAEIGSVPPERAADLVLERVALVDLLK